MISLKAYSLIFLSAISATLVVAVVVFSNVSDELDATLKKNQAQEVSVESGETVSASLPAVEIVNSKVKGSEILEKSPVVASKKTKEQILPEIEEVPEIKKMDQAFLQRQKNRRMRQARQKRMNASDDELIQHFEKEMNRIEGGDDVAAQSFRKHFKEEINKLDKIPEGEIGQVATEVEEF